MSMTSLDKLTPEQARVVVERLSGRPWEEIRDSVIRTGVKISKDKPCDIPGCFVCFGSVGGSAGR